MEREPWETELERYRRGLNPIMGALSRKFMLSPIPYGNSSKDSFIAAIHERLADIQYLFTGELKVEITLFLDEQKRLETSKTADLDNYAKLICDALKGPEGILIDDYQIQSLTISWIDVPSVSSFEVRVRGHPDEFAIKPVSLYEMSDGLFYPMSMNKWTTDGAAPLPSKVKDKIIVYLDSQIRAKLALRHELRQRGQDQVEAFQHLNPLTLSIMGFHKSRVVESGFELVHRKGGFN